MNFNTICSNCEKPIARTHAEMKKSKTGNVFCSRSCSAKFNNKLFPKRSLEGICSKCEQSISSHFTYCNQCFQDSLIENKPYGDFISGENYQRNARVRQHARNKYLKSDLPKHCILCHYSKHFDICHLKEISSFHKDSLIREINNIFNLIALCKNHHWELDHNLMSLEDLAIIQKHIVGREGIEPPSST